MERILSTSYNNYNNYQKGSISLTAIIYAEKRIHSCIAWFKVGCKVDTVKSWKISDLFRWDKASTFGMERSGRTCFVQKSNFCKSIFARLVDGAYKWYRMRAACRWCETTHYCNYHSIIEIRDRINCTNEQLEFRIGFDQGNIGNISSGIQADGQPSNE